MHQQRERLFDYLASRRESDDREGAPRSTAFEYTYGIKKYFGYYVPVTEPGTASIQMPLAHPIMRGRNPDVLVYNWVQDRRVLTAFHVTVSRNQFVQNGRFHVTVYFGGERLAYTESCGVEFSTSSAATRVGVSLLQAGKNDHKAVCPDRFHRPAPIRVRRVPIARARRQRFFRDEYPRQPQRRQQQP